MPRACASCSIIALRSGSAPASASTCTSWRLRCCPACGRRVAGRSSRAPGRIGWRRKAVPGASVVDAPRPGPRPQPRLAPAGWPPVERFAGRGGRRALDPSAADARRQRAAKVVTVHDLDFLDHPEQEPRPRSGATTPRSRRATRSAPTCRRRRFRATRLARSRAASASLPSRHRALPAGRAGLHRTAPTPEPPGPILFVGTIEPRKNLRGALRRLRALVDARSRSPAADVLAGGDRRAVGGDPRRPASRAPRLPAVSSTWATSATSERQALYREASMLVLPSLRRRFGTAGRSKR